MTAWDFVVFLLAIASPWIVTAIVWIWLAIYIAKQLVR